MSELFNAIKTVLFSVLVLMLLQVKWDGDTLESHSKDWVYRSQAGEQIQTVASGLVRASRESLQWIKSQIVSASQSQSQTQYLERDRDAHQ
jgi:hypothetical protein